MRYRCVVSYDGSKFEGYQIQKELKTVQKNIQDTIKFIMLEDVHITSSGRTDKGVHAFGQVFHFDAKKEIPTNKLKMALNTYMDQSIHISSIDIVDENFHARASAKSKVYEYILNSGEYNPIEKDYVYQYCYPIDLAKLNEIKEVFIGTHYFKNFCTNNEEFKTYTRTIKSVKIKKEKDKYIFTIEGNGFLRYMIRMIIGTMIAYQRGILTREEIEYSLSEECRKRTCYKVPSAGLYLKEVKY